MKSKVLIIFSVLVLGVCGAKASDTLNITTSTNGWLALHSWTPPAGWDSLPQSGGFDTTGWVAATAPRDEVVGSIHGCGGQYTFPSGTKTNMLWWTETPVPAYDTAIFRLEFSLDACAIPNSALSTLEGWADDEMTVYLNGVQIGHTVNNNQTGIQSGHALDKTLFFATLRNGKNVIAIKGNDLNPYSASNLYCVGVALNAQIVYDAPPCPAGINNTVADAMEGNRLLQNAPNPFSQSTEIGYVLNSTTKAQIGVNSMDGRLIRSYDISKGMGSIKIAAGELSAGAYTYTMYVDGVAAATRLMIVTGEK
jgi:hypothetical protein